MSDFFVDQVATVDVEFPDSGVVVTLKKYITAGMREELRNQMVKIDLQETARTNGNHHAEREARLETGDFFILSKMIAAVKVPEGVTKPHVPVSKGWLGSLRPEAVSRLVSVVNEHNPLVDQDQEEETPV